MGKYILGKYLRTICPGSKIWKMSDCLGKVSWLLLIVFFLWGLRSYLGFSSVSSLFVLVGDIHDHSVGVVVFVMTINLWQVSWWWSAIMSVLSWKERAIQSVSPYLVLQRKFRTCTGRSDQARILQFVMILTSMSAASVSNLSKISPNIFGWMSADRGKSKID